MMDRPNCRPERGCATRTRRRSAHAWNRWKASAVRPCVWRAGSCDIARPVAGLSRLPRRCGGLALTPCGAAVAVTGGGLSEATLRGRGHHQAGGGPSGNASAAHVHVSGKPPTGSRSSSERWIRPEGGVSPARCCLRDPAGRLRSVTGTKRQAQRAAPCCRPRGRPQHGLLRAHRQRTRRYASVASVT